MWNEPHSNESGPTEDKHSLVCIVIMIMAAYKGPTQLGVSCLFKTYTGQTQLGVSCLIKTTEGDWCVSPL